MIPYEFGYHRPDTLAQALALRRELDAGGQSPAWYAGGTEIISMARMGSIRPAAVIDVKQIPECRELAVRDGRVHLGACNTLSQVAESGLFPLLGQAVSRVADHTNQCKITLGGNLMGTIRYREAAPPLLIADARAHIAGRGGVRTVALAELFDGRLRLAPDELLLGFDLPEEAARWPFAHYKYVRADKIDYPLFTLCAALDDAGFIRLALSGLCESPFRDSAMEAALNDRSATIERRAQTATDCVSAPVLSDNLGSADYRRFRLTLALTDAIHDLEGPPC